MNVSDFTDHPRLSNKSKANSQRVRSTVAARAMPHHGSHLRQDLLARDVVGGV